MYPLSLSTPACLQTFVYFKRGVGSEVGVSGCDKKRHGGQYPMMTKPGRAVVSGDLLMEEVVVINLVVGTR